MPMTAFRYTAVRDLCAITHANASIAMLVSPQYTRVPQLQVVAALRYVTAGSYSQYIREMLAGLPESEDKEAIMAMVEAGRNDSLRYRV